MKNIRINIFAKVTMTPILKNSIYYHLIEPKKQHKIEFKI